jgi:hypothetical protein
LTSARSATTHRRQPSPWIQPPIILPRSSQPSDSMRIVACPCKAAEVLLVSICVHKFDYGLHKI